MKALVYFHILLCLVACKKDTMPSVEPQQPKVIKASGGQDRMIEPVQSSTHERKFNPNAGGNGNGNGNGNQNNDTTAWVINEHVQNWNVTWDTSVCGFFIMRWDDVKPATTNMLDSVYITDYGIGVEPISPTCAGVAVCLTNLFWTKYNSSCAVKASSTYQIRAAWSRYDNVNKVCDKYFSEWVTVTTGQRLDQCSK